MVVRNYVQCAIGLIILFAGLNIREDHFGWAVVLVIIGTFKYAVNFRAAIEMEDSK